MVEGPEGLSLVELSIDSKTAVVEGKLGVRKIHGEDAVEEVEIGVKVWELKKLFNFGNDCCNIM